MDKMHLPYFNAYLSIRQDRDSSMYRLKRKRNIEWNTNIDRLVPTRDYCYNDSDGCVYCCSKKYGGRCQAVTC